MTIHYKQDVDPRTGETLTLTQREGYQRDGFKTRYTLISPIKGTILEVVIADRTNSEFMAW